MQTANTSSQGADDFIPAPEGDTNADAPVTSAATIENQSDPTPVSIDSGIGQTALILSVVAFLVLAGLLFILRNAVRKSLIAARATIDTANAAAWSWYISLLLFGGLIIAGVADHLFGSAAYDGVTAAVLVLGLAISAKMTARARQSA